MSRLEAGKGPVLITGGAGFAASWLLPELAAAGYSLVATHRPGQSAPPSAAAAPRWTALDVRDGAAVRELVSGLQPAAVVHLAAVAVPGQASADPLHALQTNYVAVDQLLRALRGTPARLLLVSTGEVYGRRSASAAPADEDDALAPTNLYAATKAAAEQRAALAAERDGLDVVIARPFNHSGPGRPPAYAEASFARQLALAERGSAPPRVQVGNLAPIRDWSDVRDVAHAYRLLLERAEPGQVYNVCSGVGRSVGQVLDELRARAHLPVAVQIDAERYEDVPPDRLALVGNPAKLQRLGWAPRHSLASTLAALLDDWRARA